MPLIPVNQAEPQTLPAGMRLLRKKNAFNIPAPTAGAMIAILPDGYFPVISA